MFPPTSTRLRGVPLFLLLCTTAFAQAIQWSSTQNNGTYDWFAGSNWSGSFVPTVNRAAITVAGNPTYTISTNAAASNVTVAGLDLNAAGATLLFDLADTGRTVNLGSAVSTWSAGNVEVRTAAGIYGNGAANTSLSIGSGVQLLYSTSTATRYLQNLTVANSGTIHGTSGVLSIYGVTLTNNSGGLIFADGAEIDFAASTMLANAGTIRANGPAGKLYFSGTETTANLGTVDLVGGGHAYLAGTLNNTGATLNAPTTSGMFELSGGTINGGNIAAGALTFTNAGGNITGASILGNVALGASARVTVGGNTTLDPTATKLDLANNAGLYWNQSGSISGKTITLGSGAYIDVTGASNTLTFAANVTGTGDLQIFTDGSTGTAITNLGTLTHNNGSGYIYAPTFSNSGNITANTASSLEIGSYYNAYSTTNASGGKITADGSGTTVYLDGNIANLGTLVASNGGVLQFRTGYSTHQTTANLGSIQISTGGHVYLTGILENGNATLTAPTGGSYELLGGTINGGNIAVGALTITSSGGNLTGVSILGNVSLGTSAHVTVGGNTTLDPTATNIDLANSAGVYWNQSGTISGKTITFGSGAYVDVTGANHTLTIAANVTGTGDIQLYTDGSAGTAITNLGTLTQNNSGGSIYAPTFSNSGNITANSGATLEIGSYYSAYSTTNSSGGKITADGANTVVYLDGNIVNQGTLLASNGGALEFRTGYSSHQTTANLGTIQISNGGHVYLNGILENGNATLTAPTGGAYELYGGTINGGNIAYGSLMLTTSGGTLSGVAIQGNVALGSSARVTLTGNTTLDPTATAIGLANNAVVYWNQTGTIAGKTITFGSGAVLELTGANNTLTIASNVNGSGDIQVYTDGSTGTAITNLGTFTQNNGSGYISANMLTNGGNITASAGSNLDIGSYYNTYTTTNSSGGRITADGTNTIVYLDGNIANQGTLIASNGGALQFRTGYSSTQTTANLGTIQISNGGHVYLNGTLDNTGATLNAPTGGAFELYGGTINGGNVSAGALTLTTSSGTLNGVAWFGNLTLGASARAYLTGSTTLDPTSTAISLGSNAGLYWKQIGAIAGKAITFSPGAFIQVTGVGNALTLNSDVTASGEISVTSDGSSGTSVTNLGTLNHTSSSGNLYAPTFTNGGNVTASLGSNLEIGNYYNSYTITNSSTGKITADGAGTLVYLDGNLANQGTLVAQNGGVLQFRTGYSTPQTTANLGTIQISNGGHVYLNGTLTNTGATLNAPSGGMFELYGGTIMGGNVSNGALAFTSSGGTLNGVALLGNVTLANSARVTLTGNTTLDPTATSIGLGSSAGVYWNQVGTIAGKAMTFGSGAIINVTGGNNALTLASNVTATGDIQMTSDGSSGTSITNLGTITHNTGSGSLYANTFVNGGNITAAAGSNLEIGYYYNTYSTTNGSTGTITADGTNAIIYLDGNVANQGSLVAKNGGTLEYRTGYSSTQTTANLGNVTISNGGHVYLNGTLDNSNATLPTPTGGMFELYGGTINSGTVSNTALTFTGNGGTLNGVNLQGNVSLPTSSRVTLTGNTTFATGVNAITLGGSAGIYWQQSGTLSGKALTFGSNAYWDIVGGNSSLTLAANTTATGDVQVFTDGSAGTSLTNLGTINHTTGSGSLSAMTVTNSGTIAVSSGTNFVFGYSATNATASNTSTGVLRLTGGTLTVNTPVASPMVNFGTIDVQSGTFYTNNRVTNGTGGTIQGAGVITGNMILAGGTIAPGNSGIGTMTFYSGSLTVTGASTFAVDIGGATSDRIQFQYPSGNINIGSGLLALSLNLLSAPTANTTYNLISITTGGNYTISGSFAGLLNSGSTVTANYGGNAYNFTLNYQPTFVSLTYAPVSVPEPSTYLLIGAGLVIVGFGAWRRRSAKA